MPTRYRRGFRVILLGMKKGDSFSVSKSSLNGVYSAARIANVKICIRKIDNNTSRVWKVS